MQYLKINNFSMLKLEKAKKGKWQKEENIFYLTAKC